MDRRKFLCGAAIGAAIALPLGCGNKNKANPEEGTEGPPEGMKAPPANPAEDHAQDAGEEQSGPQ